MKKLALLSLCAVTQWACAAQPVPTATSSAQAESWITTLDRDNPLVGKIWSSSARRFVTFEEVVMRMSAARYVLLGERHDNADHHRLQARVLDAIVNLGRRPALVLEMLDLNQQAAVEAYLRGASTTAQGLADAVRWQDSGWPPFSQYQPIFEVALTRKLFIASGNLSRESARSLVKQGLSALPEARVRDLWLDRPFPEALEAALADELRASHCGHLPESMIAPMALAQHARDAQMARIMLERGAASGAVLVTGAGHARLDRAVPYYLRLAQPDAAIVSIAFREVSRGVTEPRDAESEAYDYVWFTPRLTDEDPCAAFTKPK